MMRWCKTFFMLGVMAALAWPAAVPARAQSGTRISVQPPDTQVPVGNDLSLDLVVTNGTNVDAFDVTVAYDSNVLTLRDWAFGDYLSNLAEVTQFNQPGILRVAATQLAKPPVSGDGVLLTLNFRAQAAGVSQVEITQAEFASATGTLTKPERIDGTVTALVAPTYTATMTVIATPLRTPTPLLTTTTTFTPTSIATMGNAATTTALFGATATRAAQLTRTPSAPDQASPTPGADQAYPGENLPVIPGATDPAGGQPEGAPTDGLPTDLDPTPDAVGEGEAVEEPVEEADWLERLLWGVLIAGGLAIGVMFLIIIRRNTHREHHKEEDLLL